MQPPVAPDPQSTPETPYGPWLMPEHVRRRMKLAQQRMSRRSEPSAANQALNRRLDADL